VDTLNCSKGDQGISFSYYNTIFC